MAFATRRFVKHIDKYSVTHRLEIQEDGFGGSESSIDTTGQVFQFEHETHASEDQEILNVYENPVQKGSIELSLLIQNATDKTLLDDIFNGDEDDFRLVWKIDGSIFWTGTILNDMLEYPESDYPYMAKLWAKDFSRLEVTDYSLDDTRQTLITTFADLIGNLGYGLDIETHTSWINENTTDGTDFLQQIYHETKALREFGRTGDEADTTITVYEALEVMCRNFGCVVRQEGNVFKIIQYSEYETPTAVNVTVYNSDGTQKTAATSTDLTLDASANDITVTSLSLTRAFKGIRKATNTYEHRTKVSNIQFPDTISLDTNDTETAFAQVFLSDGDQSIDLNGLVRAVVQSGGGPNVNSNIKIRAGTSGGTEYWWNGTSWQTSIFTLEDDLVHQGGNVYSSNVSYSTTDIPADADGQIEISFIIADDPDGFSIAATTEYKYFEFTLNNPIAQENSTSIDYQLTQTGEYSTKFELSKTWFGDGPLSYSVGALRHGSGDGDVTTDSWQRRGSTAYRNLHENLLKEIVDIQRGNRIRTSGDMLGADYDPERILGYRGKNLAYTGGRFDGEGGDWHPVLFEINVVTGTDTFDDIPKFADEAGGTGSSGGGSGAGLTLSDLDPRYVNIDGDTMTGALDMGDNNISNVARLLATEVEIDGDWQLRTQTPGSVNRLFVDPITADSNVEIFVAPSGTATSARFTLADGSNQTNYEGIEIAADELTNRITSLTEGTGTIRELQIRVDGNEDLSLWRNSTKYIDLVSGGVTISQALTGTSADFSGALDASTLRTDTGKFLAPTSYQFRNAGDTGFRDVQMAGLTATTATFSGLTTHQGGISVTGGDLSVINGTTVTDVKYFGIESNRSAVYVRPTSNDSQALRIGAASNLQRWNEVYIDAVNTYFPNLLTAQGGIEITAGNLAVNKTGATEALDVNGNGLFSGDLQVDGGLYAAEFIVEQTRVMTDFRMSVGGGRVKSVTGSGGTETVTLEDDFNNANPFAAGDIILIQQRTGAFSGTIIKRIYREVASISGLDVTFQTTNITWTAGTANDDTGSISAGDDMTIVGATSASANTATRDHYIHYDIAGVNIPAIRWFDGVQDVGGGSEIMRAGGLNGYDGSFGAQEIGLAGKIDGSLAFAVTDIQGKIASAFFDSTDLWGYESGYAGDTTDKSNSSIRLDFANGQLFYDALVVEIYNPLLTSAYGTSPSDVSISGDEWDVSAGAITNTTATNDIVVISGGYIHRFGITTIELSGTYQFLFSMQEPDNNGNGTGKIQLIINGNTVEKTLDSHDSSTSASYDSGDVSFSFDIDISNFNLTVGENYEVQFVIESFVEKTGGTDGELVQVNTIIKEPLSILGIT